MTLKSRWIGLVTILLLFAMAPSSFAQVQIQIFPDFSSQEVQTNRNAQTARPGTNGAGLLVSGSLLGASPLTATTLRIAYPGPITSQPAAASNDDGVNCIDGSLTPSTFVCPSSGAAGIPTGDPMRIEGATGVFASVGRLRLNTVSSRIEMTLPNSAGGLTGGSTATNSSSGVFRIVGVRIDANGKSGAQTFSASLNNSANNYLLSTSTGTIINNIGPGLAGAPAIGLAPGGTAITGCSPVPSGGNPPAGTATIFTNRNVPRTCGAFTLTEGFASAWRSQLQSGNSSTGPSAGPNAGSQIKLTFNNVPAGVTLTLTSNRGLASSNSSLNMTLSTTSITSSSTSAVLTFVNTSTRDVEVAEIDYTIGQLSTTAAVTSPGSISVTATMYPFGDGVDSSGLPRQDQGYPSFVEGEVGPTTIVNIVPANTVMLMPYVFVLSPYDTGLALANTTKDPFGTSAGGATPGNGTISVDFFPTASTGGAGTPCSFTSSPTSKPGSGLSSDGTLAAGATWTVLMSQLLTAAGSCPNPFTGYAFIRANFLAAHGTATISDFKTYSLTSNVLVLPPPATTPRDSVTVEALDF